MIIRPNDNAINHEPSSESNVNIVSAVAYYVVNQSVNLRLLMSCAAVNYTIK